MSMLLGQLPAGWLLPEPNMSPIPTPSLNPNPNPNPNPITLTLSQLNNITFTSNQSVARRLALESRVNDCYSKQQTRIIVRPNQILSMNFVTSAK